jgi:hypothetical protein
MNKKAIEKLADMIITGGDISPVMLERQYKKIKEKLKSVDVTRLNIQELKLLLAYENLKDGAEQEFINEIINSEDTIYKNKVDLLKQLENFDY